MKLLFSTGKSFMVDGLREKLREFYSDKVRAEVRDLAALNNVKLITALPLPHVRQIADVEELLLAMQGKLSQSAWIACDPENCGTPSRESERSIPDRHSSPIPSFNGVRQSKFTIDHGPWSRV